MPLVCSVVTVDYVREDVELLVQEFDLLSILSAILVACSFVYLIHIKAESDVLLTNQLCFFFAPPV